MPEYLEGWDQMPTISQTHLKFSPLNFMNADLQTRSLKQLASPHLGTSDFVYKHPLNWSKQEIRLIEILPDDQFSSPIAIKLHHVSLQDDPVYTALSYAWGDQIMMKATIVNGEEFRITANLEAALREIRREQHNDEMILLWADQISIDQMNHGEKSDQVLNMDKIYKKAKEVFIWLGEADEDTELAISSLSQTAAQAKAIGIENYATSYDYQLREESSLDQKIKPMICSAAVFEDRHWPAVYDLITRPWWKRVWISQEILLAYSARLACGKYRLDWSEMTRVVAACATFCHRAQFLPATEYMNILTIIQKSHSRYGPGQSVHSTQ